MSTPEQHGVLELDIKRLIRFAADPAAAATDAAEASAASGVPSGPRFDAAVSGAKAVLRHAAATGSRKVTVSELEHLAGEMLNDQALTGLVEDGGW